MFYHGTYECILLLTVTPAAKDNFCPPLSPFCCGMTEGVFRQFQWLLADLSFPFLHYKPDGHGHQRDNGNGGREEIEINGDGKITEQEFVSVLVKYIEQG